MALDPPDGHPHQVLLLLSCGHVRSLETRVRCVRCEWDKGAPRVLQKPDYQQRLLWARSELERFRRVQASQDGA